MANQVDYYFDVGSPATYLSWTQMKKLAEETGAEINYKPMLIGGLFKAIGNSSPITVPAKGKWLFSDLTRFAKRYEVPFVMNDNFPVNTLYLMRGLTGYLEDERFLALADGIFDGMWVSNKNMNEPEVIGAIVSDAGIKPDAFMAKINEPEVKQRLIDVTSEAESRGAFGAPTFFVGDEMFWGQDRLDFVYDALTS